jgi:hypothetical protein
MAGPLIKSLAASDQRVSGIAEPELRTSLTVGAYS